MQRIPNISTDSPPVALFILSAVFLLAAIFCQQVRQFVPVDCTWYWIGFLVFLLLGIFFALRSGR